MLLALHCFIQEAHAMALGMRTLGKLMRGNAVMVGRGMLYDDITKTIGDTPVVKISDKLCPEGVDLYAKCEYFNPLSSVKDRLALAIIQDAEARGDLKPGDTVVEATSGNTGIAVAMACARAPHEARIPVRAALSAPLKPLHGLRRRSARSAATSALSAWPSPSRSSAAS